MKLNVKKCYSRVVGIALVGLLLSLTGCGRGADPHPPLPDMALDADRFFVAGLSSGGSMAQQLFLSWPEEVKGLAVFAAAPYACARGGVNAALFQCMSTRAGRPNADRLVQQIHTDAAAGKIGDPSAAAQSRVFIYQAGRDAVVQTAVTDVTLALYQQLLLSDQVNSDQVNSDQVKGLTLPQAGHGFPTQNRGNACGSSEPPYVNACDQEGAAVSLAHLDGELRRPLRSEPQGQLARFSQRPFAQNSRGLADYGYFYRPPNCLEGNDCGLKMVLHGCEQGAEVVGTRFIEKSGYLQQADARDLVLVFPQVSKTLPNPRGCWDWWGYESSAFDTREGPQVEALTKIWRQLLEK